MIPYPAYKSTNLPWLPKIPEHWSRLRYKDILVPKDIRVGKDTSYTLLSLTKQGVIIRDISEGKGKFPKDFDTYKVVAKNDFILCLFDVDETPRTVGVANDNGMITGAYDIFTVRRCNLRWLYYHFLSLDDRKSLKSLYRGLRKTIPLPSLLSSHVYLPPVAEQEQIVRYLDAMTAKINKLIRAKKKQIKTKRELLEIYLFSEKGDKTLLGQWNSSFPALWKKQKASRIFCERNAKGFKDKLLLAVTQDFGVVFKKDCFQRFVQPRDVATQKLVCPYDFVISLRAFQGGIETSFVEGVVSPAYSVFYLKEESLLLETYFQFLFKSPYFVNYLNSLVRDIRDGKKISFDDFRDTELPIPPQSHLIMIKRLADELDILNKRLKDLTSLLQEYKTSLISAVVTGQLDIRNIPVEDVIPDNLIPEDDSPSEIEEEPTTEESEE